MSILNRHTWGQRFESWLKDAGLQAKSYHWERAGGTSELLAMGLTQAHDRPVVVFLHGLGNDALFPNLSLFKHLLGAGYNIVTADIDGHGKGSTSLFDAKEVRNFVSDLIERLDEIVIGRPRLHLSGYSFGACLLLDYAVHNPERVQSLSLIGMPIHLGFSYLIAAELLSPLKHTYLAAIKDYGFFGIHPAVGPILRNRYPVRIKENHNQTYFQIAGQTISDINPLAKLQLVTFPALYIAGSWDHIAKDPVSSDFLASLKIQRFYLPGETHFTSMFSSKLGRRIEVLLRNAP